MSTAVTTIETKVMSFESDFSLVNEYGLNFRRESNFALQLLKANDYLLSVAQKSPESLKRSLTNLAAIGISLNPATKESYLVPRGGEICLDISAIGLIKLATDSGSILWGQAKLVYEKDTYKNIGIGQLPLHEYESFGDRGKLIGGYTVVKTKDGDFLTEEMSLADCHGIRDRSEAWKAFVAKKTKSCPWFTDEGEMVKKTIIKRAQKYWPKSKRVDEAIHILNKHEGIDFEKEQRGAFVNTPSDDIKADDKAFKNIRDLLAFNGKEEGSLIKYINTKFKSNIQSIEEMDAAMIDETYRAMGK